MILTHRIAIAIAASTLALGSLGVAVGSPMPTGVPSSQAPTSAAPSAAAAQAQAPSAVATPAPAAAPTTNVALLRPMAPTIATGYDAWKEGNACPGFPQTKIDDLTVGSDLVACGKRIKICISGRCVIAQKRDTGPFRDGRHIDMNVGTIRALGFRSLDHFGVRPVTWAPVASDPTRTVASVK